MKFKLSQVTVLVITALSASAMGADISKPINVIDNKMGGITDIPGYELTGKSGSNDTVVYTGSVKSSRAPIVFVGRETATQSDGYVDSYTSNNIIHYITVYDFTYSYSPIAIDTLTVDDSAVLINGMADNLTVRNGSKVTITGENAYADYLGGNYKNPNKTEINGHRVYWNGLQNNRTDSIFIGTANGKYYQGSTQSLDGRTIGKTKNANQGPSGTLTIHGTDIQDTRLDPADRGEYLLSLNDQFFDSVQIVGERSASQKAKFMGNSGQVLNGENGRKAISLDAEFTGDEASGKHAYQNVGSNGLSIDAKMDYTHQTIAQNGEARNTVLVNNSRQIVSGKAHKNTLTDSNQTISQGGLATDNTITNGKQTVEGQALTNTITNGIQDISGEFALANDNKLTNVDQRVTKGANANRNTLKDSTQFVDDDATTTENILNGKSTMRVGMGGTADDNTLNGTSHLTVEAGGKATGKTSLNDASSATLFAATQNGAYVEDLALNSTTRRYTVDIMAGAQNYDAVDIGTLTGKGDMHFVHTAPAADYTLLNIGTLGNKLHPTDTSIDFTMNSNIRSGKSDFIEMNNAYGQHYVTIIEKDTGEEAVLKRPQSADFAHVANENDDSNAVFGMKDTYGNILDYMDAGTYIHEIQSRKGSAGKDTVWSFTATEMLTPSARAVLALSSAPQLMYNNELDSMRGRLQMLRTHEAIQNGIWMQAIGSNTKVDKDQVKYKLNHAGMELGADYQVALNSDNKLVMGAFTGFDKGDVKNDWAGTSKMDSYTFGAYATYLNTNGWYVDGILKYNRFDNTLHTTSTNGYDVNSDGYNTSVWGVSLETGYNFSFSNDMFVTPYGQLAYNTMSSKNIRLNNKMEAEIKGQDSFTSELGLSAGKDFRFNNGVLFSPYVRAAWNHQYENGNEVEFNRFNTVNLDLSGSTGKFGLGFNAMYSDVNLYMELRHIAGDAVSAPINGEVGVRYNF